MLDIVNVVKRYNGKAAVDGVSFSVGPGEIFGLLGPNGAGKTSLIRMIMDILRPDAGEIRLFGKPMSPELQDRLGYLPEERGLYQRQKVIDVLVFLAEIKGLSRHAATARADRYLDRVGLFESRNRTMRELSKGMQQKLQIAAVLQHEPQLAILDEPFIGLDPVNREVVLELLRETTARGASIILSTHLMEQAEMLCSRAAIIHRGKQVLLGPVRELKERHADNAVSVDCSLDLAGHPMIARRDNGRLFLNEGVAPEAFLGDLIAKGASIRRFERALPTLNEVFVKAVKEP